MLLFALAYLAGALTIVSPCILPILPFAFACAGQPFLRGGLPMLAGMAASFTFVATLASVAGGWAVAANQYGRVAAMALLALFGLTLLMPGLSGLLTAPLVALGNGLTRAAHHGDGDRARTTTLSSALLGVATGLLWSPCAGPILGLILTGAALSGPSIGASILLLGYAAGAATSLALALLLGGRVIAAMKRSLGVGEWLRRGLGALTLVAIGAIALGADTGVLTRLSLDSAAWIEQDLLDRLPPASVENPLATTADPTTLPVEGHLPSLSGATDWINSWPLTAEDLKDKVVLVDFWTYSCINCLRAIPYVRAWSEKYKDQGLVVIGVHAPEFAFERDVGNVKKAVAELNIDYSVAIDNNRAIWRAFRNRYWPAHYFIDASGRIRHHHFGEGDYAHSEHVIQQLLAEIGRKDVDQSVVSVAASGAQAAPNFEEALSPETYIGFSRAENFVSPGGVAPDATHVYAPGLPRLNQWSLVGAWTVGREHAHLDSPDGGIVYRFHARDLHLVLGPAADGKPVRFRVTIDGRDPGDAHGVDVNADGEGVVTSHRLYQLIRQSGKVGDREFMIRFLDPGVDAYAFTFG
jgi:cytochrome c biogenesis protein CcdA/thiol-disulfide isomerase/thioredoxin